MLETHFDMIKEIRKRIENLENICNAKGVIQNFAGEKQKVS